RESLAAARSPDGTVFAVGGDDGTQPLDRVESLPPNGSAWSTLPSLPTARTALAATAGTDGRVYAVGGCVQLTIAFRCQQATAAAEMFDPATSQWTAVAPLPTARVALAAATGPGGAIYVAGGVGAGNQAMGTVDVLSPTTGTWSSGPALPTPRAGL